MLTINIYFTSWHWKWYIQVSLNNIPKDLWSMCEMIILKSWVFIFRENVEKSAEAAEARKQAEINEVNSLRPKVRVNVHDPRARAVADSVKVRYLDNSKRQGMGGHYNAKKKTWNSIGYHPIPNRFLSALKYFVVNLKMDGSILLLVLTWKYYGQRLNPWSRQIFLLLSFLFLSSYPYFVRLKFYFLIITLFFYNNAKVCLQEKITQCRHPVVQ